MVHEGYVAHLHVTNKNDKHKIHKIYARQYRNTMNNYGFKVLACIRLGHHDIISTVDLISFRFRLTLKVSLNSTAVQLTVRELCPS